MAGVILGELGVILLLAIANGLFAGAEIAFLSVRTSRLRELAEHEGRKSAAVLLELRRHPERFLATVQVGITVIGATAAAFGGATLARELTVQVRRAGLGERSDDVALAIVVAGVSYLTLVFGELVPKSLALRFAERYALLAARPLTALARVANPIVWFLTASSNVVLRIFGKRTTFSETRLSREELQQLVEEAGIAGSIAPDAGEIAMRALAFDTVRAASLLVPRVKMQCFQVDADPERVRRDLSSFGHSRFPVHDGRVDHVLGYVRARDLYAELDRGARDPVRAALRPALILPETIGAVAALRAMQGHQTPLSVLIDETGGVAGLLTIRDLIEELVGEMLDEHQSPSRAIAPQPDGSVMLLGSVPVHEANRELGLSLPEGPDWTTVGGLTRSLTSGMPAQGGCVLLPDGTRIDVVEVNAHHIERIRIVTPQRSASLDDPGEFNSP